MVDGGGLEAWPQLAAKPHLCEARRADTRCVVPHGAGSYPATSKDAVVRAASLHIFGMRCLAARSSGRMARETG